MTKNGEHISIICFAMFSLLLASCADKPRSGKNLSKVVGTASKNLDKFTVLKPLAPFAVEKYESTVPTSPNEKVDGANLATQKLPRVAVSPKKLSSLRTQDFSQLVGLNSTGLNRLFGNPVLVRRETEAEVWQYRAGDCVLHIFLYRDGANKPYRVVHVEANHSKRTKTIRASAEQKSLERTNFLKLCFSRLFYKAKDLKPSR